MKKKHFLTIFITAVLLSVCLSAFVFASEETKYKTISSFDEESGILTFDIYLSEGKAIVGYCSFDYDSSVLTLLDSSSGAVPETVPDTVEESSAIYLRSVVKADGNFVITDNGKGSSNLIDTKEGYVFFAWFIPSSVAENVDATEEDIKIATIRFSVNEGKTPEKDSITVAKKELTDNVNGWYPGLIIVLNRDKDQNHYNGEDKGAEYYIAEFETVEDSNSDTEDESEDSENTDGETENGENTEDVTPESDKKEEDKDETEENPSSDDENKSEEGTDDNEDDSSSSSTEETEDIDDGEDTSGSETPEGFIDPDEDDGEKETDSGCGNVTEEQSEAPDCAQTVDFSIEITPDIQEAKIKWKTPEEIDAIDSYSIVVCDSDFDIVKNISGITSITNSYTLQKLYGETEYKVYIIARCGSSLYMSRVETFTTKNYAEYPPAVSFTVTYEKKGTYLYGFNTESVLYGGYVSKTPVVIPKNGQLFAGWSTDGKNVIDISNYKIYSDTVFYPVLSDTDIPRKPYITGYSDGTFRPNGNITRAEAATLISRISGEYDKNRRYCHTFTDCESTMWYNKAIAFCSSYGFINGYSDGTFKPNGNITRAEFATILVRVFGYEKTTGINVFSDLDNHWAKPYISVLYEEGIIKPDIDGNYRPDQNLTRQDAVQMLNACLKILPDKAVIDSRIAENGYIFSDVPHYSEYYYDIMAAVLD